MKNKIEETIDTYNNIVKEYIDYFNTVDLKGNVQFQSEMDVLVNSLESGSSILDVGTAIGVYPKYLTERCNKDFKVTGIDSSENMIKVAEGNAPKATFEVMDMRYLEFQDNSFDAIICLATLIHLDDTEALKVLDKFDTILKSNGLMIINVVEYVSGEKELYIPEPFNPKYNTYFNSYTKDFFTDYFKNKGYEILNIFDNPVFNEEELKEPSMDTNQFSVIVRKSNIGD